MICLYIPLYYWSLKKIYFFASPGTTRTPMVKAIFDDPELAKKYIETIPLGEVVEPEDLANGALYLASDEARRVTGTELVVDAGMSL